MKEDLPPRRSSLREDIKAALDKSGITLEKASALNLDTGEKHYFESYMEAIEFTKGKKGRWYISAPSVSYKGVKNP